MSGGSHTAVLLEQAVDGLKVRSDGCYVDCTFGRGGHSRLILARLGRAGRLIALDRDPQAVAAGGEIDDGRFRMLHGRFSRLAELAEEAGVTRAHGIRAEEVDEVTVGVPEPGWKIIGDPEPAKQSPASVVDGQFSMAFCAAVALRTGGFVWDDYARHLGDPATLALCKRVRTWVDPKAQADFPAEMSASVRIQTGRGAFNTYVRVPKGEPANFLSPAELRAKFDGLAGPYLSGRRRDELASALLALDEAQDIGALLRLTRPDETSGRRVAAAGR